MANKNPNAGKPGYDKYGVKTMAQRKKEKAQAAKEKIQKEYQEKTDILYAASHLWVDAVIDPVETRSWISMGIDIANQAPASEKFNMGVLQV